MKTISSLRNAFALYFDEMERCDTVGGHWALLHLALTLPDICAVLESTTDRGNRERYEGWCAQHFSGPHALSASDRYQIRCAVLHQGTTLPRSGQYASISFTAPGATDMDFHQDVTVEANGKKYLCWT